MTQREEFTLADTVNHVFCDTVCEPVCNRKKDIIEGYLDENGIPCARNCCTLFNQFAKNVDKAFGKKRGL